MNECFTSSSLPPLPKLSIQAISVQSLCLKSCLAKPFELGRLISTICMQHDKKIHMYVYVANIKIGWVETDSNLHSNSIQYTFQ